MTRADKLRRLAALEIENTEPVAPASGTFYRRILAAAILAASVSGCAGAQKIAIMPTPIICKQLLELDPTYVGYGEYLNELRNRGADCAEYMKNYTPD
jgi:hypothetical protein